MTLEPFYALRRLGVRQVEAEFEGYGGDGLLYSINAVPQIKLPHEIDRFLTKFFSEHLRTDVRTRFPLDGYGCDALYVLSLDDLSLRVCATAPCYGAVVRMYGDDFDLDEVDVQFEIVCDERRLFKWPSAHEQLQWLEFVNSLSEH